MLERIEQELELLRQRFPKLEFQEEGWWARIPSFPLPEGWGQSSADVVFQIPPQYPGGQPYGIYVPAGLRFTGSVPDKYKEPAPTQPPFPGSWGIFSWQPDGQWIPTSDIHAGPNLLNWVLGFAERFRLGV